MAFFWSMQELKSSVVSLRVALLAFLIRLIILSIFEINYKINLEIINFNYGIIILFIHLHKNVITVQRLAWFVHKK